jgi:2-methylcitrate dehydratase PrpD
VGSKGISFFRLVRFVPCFQWALFNSALVRYVNLLDSYMSPGGLCHPSDNFGAVLAAAEQVGASGEEFMLSLAVAYEIQCRFTAAVPVMVKGFNHATQLAMSAAAGAGKLFGLSAGQIVNAIAIATADNVSLALCVGGAGGWKRTGDAVFAERCRDTSILKMTLQTRASRSPIPPAALLRFHESS